MLDITDVLGTPGDRDGLPRPGRRAAENAAAALEVMSRFAIDPRWLVYLPPTMSPVPTSALPGLLEHPEQAFADYRRDGVEQVVCEEKHMGSRAVALICASARAAADRFGADDGQPGALWTRTGRPFLGAGAGRGAGDPAGRAAQAAGLFAELGTSWLLLDAELMPWSAKAGQLLRDQYAAVGAAARGAVPAAVTALEQAAARGLDVGRCWTAPARGRRTRPRSPPRTGGTAGRPTAWPACASRRSSCWPRGDGGQSRPHAWHLEVADRLVSADRELLAPTRRMVADLADPASVSRGDRLVGGADGGGGEGMVVKPAANLTRGAATALVQPGLKVRGREYLRIIYGPDYTEPDNLGRLRARGLGHKRSLALREYALGLEAVDRLARGEPLWRVHECVFAVLALESEPVDPRL